MSSGRRTTDRRRRVLYSTHQADQSTPTAASRRAIERLREARRPTAAYGSRVQRRLRGRWFSLVPVRRRTFTVASALLVLIALLLCTAHYASVSWPAISYRPDISRPLRLDQPDSFGRWFMIAMLASASGICLLIYQLRRYRLDDYRGHYRLWRMVLIALAFASVNALVGILDWGGALLDLLFGKRVALSGGDWIRVVVGLGGAVLALRLVAEVRRSRFSLMTMLGVCGILLIPQAAQWNVMTVDSLAKWIAVTSAPLLASTLLVVSLVGYLRMLYREVRELEDSTSLSQLLGQMKLRIFSSTNRDEEPEQDSRPKSRQEKRERVAPKSQLPNSQAVRPQPTTPEQADDHDEDQTEVDQGTKKRGWFGRREKGERDPASTTADQSTEGDSQASDADDQTGSDQTDSKKGKRRWFGMRAATAESQSDTDSGVDSDSTLEQEESDGQAAPARRSRFSMRLKPRDAPADAATEVENPAATESDDQDDLADSPPQSGGLRGWFGRKKPEPDGRPSDVEQPNTEDDGSMENPGNNDEYIDPDSLDWNSMSKAERRRMKKQMRRQERAA